MRIGSTMESGDVGVLEAGAPVQSAAAEAEIPADAAMVMSALDAGGGSRFDRRNTRRQTYRVKARLRLFSDGPDAAPSVLYTRDVSRRAMGFVSPNRLPLGHGGVVELPDADGNMLSLHCTLLRCREAAPGWFEGNVYFNRDQSQFDPE